MRRSHAVDCFILHVLLATNVFRATGCRRDSFATLTAKIRSVNNDIFTTNVTGCVENASFHHLNVTVVEVYIVDQPVPHLDAGVVQNLDRLELATFKNCSTETVEPRSFGNVPQLKGVAIAEGLLKTIPKGVYQGLPSLSIIQLTTNEINRIEDGAFANISTLKKLTLSRNKLETWNANWFENNANLELVNFERNLMRKIPADAFPNMPNLTTIWFDRNEIACIEPNAFRGLDRLVDLGLSFNHLTVVDPEAFPYNFRVDNLFLSANKLNFLETKLMDRAKVKSIYLLNNPWHCSCLYAFVELLDFYKTDIRSPEFCLDDAVPTCMNDEDAPCVRTANKTLTRSFLNLVRRVIVTTNNTRLNECYRFD